MYVYVYIYIYAFYITFDHSTWYTVYYIILCIQCCSCFIWVHCTFANLTRNGALMAGPVPGSTVMLGNPPLSDQIRAWRESISRWTSLSFDLHTSQITQHQDASGPFGFFALLSTSVQASSLVSDRQWVQKFQYHDTFMTIGQKPPAFFPRCGTGTWRCRLASSSSLERSDSSCAVWSSDWQIEGIKEQNHKSHPDHKDCKARYISSVVKRTSFSCQKSEESSSSFVRSGRPPATVQDPCLLSPWPCAAGLRIAQSNQKAPSSFKLHLALCEHAVEPKTIRASWSSYLRTCSRTKRHACIMIIMLHPVSFRSIQLNKSQHPVDLVRRTRSFSVPCSSFQIHRPTTQATRPSGSNSYHSLNGILQSPTEVWA